MTPQQKENRCRLENRKYLIGITGGIGSGKSYVSDLLTRNFGVPVYDCDAEAKRLTATSEDIRRQLIQLVGPAVFNGQELVRSRLADRLFADSRLAAKWEAVIHPAVLKDFQHWADLQPSGTVAMESAILFESGFNEYVDRVLFVDAPEEVRLGRAMLRDTASESQIRARMKMQRPELYRSHAHFIIDNNTANDTKLLEQLDEIVHKITDNKHHNSKQHHA